MNVTKEKVSAHIRWLIRRDMEEVLAMEQVCFEIPWSEENFLHALRDRNVIGMIAEIGEEIAGFVIYELHKEKLHLLNFAVLPKYQGCSVGTQLIDRLKLKLSSAMRNKIFLETRESNLIAQLFFKANGFVAFKVKDNYYDDGETAYCFKYKLEDK